MINYILLALLFIILQISFSYFYSRIGKELGLIDFPSERKRHVGAVPLVGGLVIYSSFVFFLLIFPTNIEHKIIFFSSLFIFFIGLIDDKYNIGILERIFFQIIACLIVIGFNINVSDLGQFNNLKIELGNFGILLTFLCVIGFTNAINFSDGLDGLASGYALNCILSIITFSYFNSNFSNLEPLIFLFFSISLFIFFNFGLIFSKIFLGDSGSTSIGFILACYLVLFTMPDNRHFHPILTLWATPIPVLDFFSVFLTRLLNKKNPFKPDRLHIHYLLIKKGMSNNIITLSLVFCSIFMSLLGLLFFYIFGAIHSALFFLFIFIMYYLFCFYLKKITI